MEERRKAAEADKLKPGTSWTALPRTNRLETRLAQPGRCARQMYLVSSRAEGLNVRLGELPEPLSVVCGRNLEELGIDATGLLK